MPARTSFLQPDSGILQRPRYIQLYPTTRCNQRCSFCFNAGTPCGDDLSHSNAARLLEILQENHIAEVDVMGGEPLLVPWLPDFVKAAVGGGLSINLSTNGSRPQALERLAETWRQGVRIGISLEGSSPDRHNYRTNSRNFEAALDSIRILVSRRTDPVVKTVVSRTAVEDLQGIADLVGTLGVSAYYLIHMDMTPGNGGLLRETLGYPEFVDLYEKLKADNPGMGIFKVHASCFDKDLLPRNCRCAGGVLKLSILPDGSAFPCNLFHRHPEFRLGNIFSDSLNDIWTSEKLSFFRNHRGNACGETSCTNYALCTGGCPAHGYSLCRDLDAADIRCKSFVNNLYSGTHSLPS